MSGLDRIHYLTNSGFTELRIELDDWERNRAIAQYSHFQISDRSGNYRLSISGYSGSAGMLAILSDNIAKLGN